MTLDADIIFSKRLRSDQLFSNGCAIVNADCAEDYLAIYNVETAQLESGIKSHRYVDAERVLQLMRKPGIKNRFCGETPVILSKAILEGLMSHVAQIYREPWPQVLLCCSPWTECPCIFYMRIGADCCISIIQSVDRSRS